MKKCNVCTEIKPNQLFYGDKRSSDGLKSTCKVCADHRSRLSRLKRKEHNNRIRVEYRNKTRVRFQKWKQEQGCCVCGETFPQCLELHHLDPNEKERTPSELVNYSFEAIMEEAKKCILVCANCHRKIHYGAIKL